MLPVLLGIWGFNRTMWKTGSATGHQCSRYVGPADPEKNSVSRDQANSLSSMLPGVPRSLIVEAILADPKLHADVRKARAS